MMLTFGSLFAGIGGFDLGFERANMVPAWQVEIDEYCRRVLAKHWPDVPRFEDVRNVGKHNLRAVDVICGGFPCQDVSLANSQREGFDGKRSSLWFEFARVIREIHPRWVVVENTPGLYSSNDGRDIRTIFWHFSQMGYDARGLPLPAAAFGTPHLRERIFIVAHAAGERQHSIEIFHKSALKSLSESATSCEEWGKIRLAETVRGRVRVLPDPGILRVDDGFPSELDKSRIKALGNAVVPQIAEWIGKCIAKADDPS